MVSVTAVVSVYARAVRRVAVALCVGLGLIGGAAWGSETATGSPTPVDRAAISKGVEWVWGYESQVPPDMPHVPRLRDRVRLLAVRVSRTLPEFASAAAELVTSAGVVVPGSRAIVLFEKEHGSWSSFGEPNWVDGPAASFPVACTPATPAGIRDLLCPGPWTILGVAAPAQPQSSYAVRIGTDDLRKVDWADAALPGSACGAASVIRLKDDAATVLGPADGWWSVLDVGLAGTPSEIRYGQLGRSGLHVAVVLAECNNGGGTADGQLNFFDVVFSASADQLHIVGIITPRQPLEPFTPHVPLLGAGDVRDGEIVVPEYWYGPDDPTAGGTGLATTTWEYTGGHLHVRQTVINRQPNGAHE